MYNVNVQFNINTTLRDVKTTSIFNKAIFECVSMSSDETFNVYENAVITQKANGNWQQLFRRERKRDSRTRSTIEFLALPGQPDFSPTSMELHCS